MMPTIREVNENDLPQLLQLYEHLHEVDEPIPSQEKLAAVWQEIIKNPRIFYFVAEVDEQLAASCNLTIVPNLTRGLRPYGLIENVVTHSDFRRRGLGHKVLQKALQTAWAANCYKVMLLTGSKESGTWHFYEATGFKAGKKTGFIAYPPA